MKPNFGCNPVKHYSIGINRLTLKDKKHIFFQNIIFLYVGDQWCCVKHISSTIIKYSYQIAADKAANDIILHTNAIS